MDERRKAPACNRWCEQGAGDEETFLVLGMWCKEPHLIKLVGLCEVLSSRERSRFRFLRSTIGFHVSTKTWDGTIQNFVSFKCFFLNTCTEIQSRDQPDKSQGHGSLATKIVIWLFRARSPIIFRINQIPGSQNNPNLALISKGSLFLAGSPKTEKKQIQGFQVCIQFGSIWSTFRIAQRLCFVVLPDHHVGVSKNRDTPK